MSDIAEIPVRCDDCEKRVPLKETRVVQDDPTHVVCVECAKKYEEKET